MKDFQEVPEGFRGHMAYVNALMTTASDRDLQDLENAIYVAKLQRMASALEAAGFPALTGRRFGADEVQFNLILVYAPSGTRRAEWATLEECRRLLDTAANLTPGIAFARWSKKIEPLHIPEYTLQDAIADTLQAREALRRRVEAEGMSAEDHALEYQTTSFMDLAPRRHPR